jgi:hypothetical protein
MPRMRVLHQCRLFATKGRFQAWTHRKKGRRFITVQCEWCAETRTFRIVRDLRVSLMATDGWILAHKCPG